MGTVSQCLQDTTVTHPIQLSRSVGVGHARCPSDWTAGVWWRRLRPGHGGGGVMDGLSGWERLTAGLQLRNEV